MKDAVLGFTPAVQIGAACRTSTTWNCLGCEYRLGSGALVHPVTMRLQDELLFDRRLCEECFLRWEAQVVGGMPVADAARASAGERG